jgi:Putative DNA-binding domain
MKPYAEWNEEDVRRVVADQTRESAGFEYKRADALRPRPAESDERVRARLHRLSEDDRVPLGSLSKEIKRLLKASTGTSQDAIVTELSKDISAMANAAGGVFFYGIVEKHLRAVDLQGFGPQDPSISWLEQVIASNVTPKPTVHVYPVDLSGDRGGQSVYLVHVEQSARGCQANDGRYYRRKNFENERMEDYEIRDLMHRSTSPEPLLWLATTPRHAGGEHHLVARLTNTGAVRAHDWLVELSVPSDLVIRNTLDRDGVYFQMSLLKDQRTHVWEFANTGTPFPRHPLFPRHVVELVGPGRRKIDIRLDLPSQHNAEGGGLAIGWTIYCDDVPVRVGAVPVRELPAC